MINLSVSNLYKKSIDKTWLNRIIDIALIHEGYDPLNHDVSVLIRNDEFLRKLKKKYFGIDETTDVLSFPAGDEDPESGHIYLGDIIISLPQTRRQAEMAGKSFDQEFALLIVHGILHLIGYDHVDEPTRINMWAHQDDILSKVFENTSHD